MLKKSKHFIISGLMVSVFGQTDRIMLKLMIGDAVSGYYSAAITCAGMTTFVFLAVIESIRPVIFENKLNNESGYEKNVCRMYSIIFFMALCQSVVLTIAAKPIVLLLYGSQYLPTAVVLQIITWYSAFSYIGAAKDVWILAEGKERYIWIINLIGAVLNVICNLLLIPILGACGAAIASVMTQFFTNFVLNFIIREMRPCGVLMVKSLNPKLIYETLKSVKNIVRR